MTILKEEKKEKIEYERIVKLVKKAGKEAEKFVQNNMQMNKRLQIKYT